MTSAEHQSYIHQYYKFTSQLQVHLLNFSPDKYSRALFKVAKEMLNHVKSFHKGERVFTHPAFPFLPSSEPIETQLETCNTLTSNLENFQLNQLGNTKSRSYFRAYTKVKIAFKTALQSLSREDDRFIQTQKAWLAVKTSHRNSPLYHRIQIAYSLDKLNLSDITLIGTSVRTHDELLMTTIGIYSTIILDSLLLAKPDSTFQLPPIENVSQDLYLKFRGKQLEVVNTLPGLERFEFVWRDLVSGIVEVKCG
jgi:hypothetical protein